MTAVECETKARGASALAGWIYFCKICPNKTLMNVTVIHHDPLAQGKLILPKKLEAEVWITRTVLSDCRQTEF